MPIRFRCVYCTRLLGIASRKAGAVTRCPQCGNEIIVPLKSDDEADETNAAEPPPRVVEPVRVVTEAPPAPAPKAPAAAKPKPRPKDGDEPLFIGDDIDDLLGLPKVPKPTPREPAGPKPVQGLDVMSLDEGRPKAFVFTPQWITLIVVGLAFVLLLTLSLGLFLGTRMARGS